LEIRVAHSGPIELVEIGLKKFDDGFEFELVFGGEVGELLVGFEGGLGGGFDIGLDGQFELWCAGGGWGSAIGGKVVVENAVNAEGDEEGLVFGREMGKLEGEVRVGFGDTGESGEDAHEGAVHAIAVAHIEQDVGGSGVIDFLFNVGFEGGAGAEVAATVDADIDVRVYLCGGQIVWMIDTFHMHNSRN
jgi:hypothetical protein